MSAAVLEFKRSAIWSAALTIPIFLLGLFLFDAHGAHVFQFTAPLGLFIIMPWAAIQDSGLYYRLGPGALPLIAIAQWAWYFVPVCLVRFVAARLRTTHPQQS
jgi:hypothetical protein